MDNDSRLFSLTAVNALSSIQCSDTVGWVTADIRPVQKCTN